MLLPYRGVCYNIHMETTPWEVKLSDQYIAGFLDGDGSIVALMGPTKQRRFTHRVKLRINLTQKTKDRFILKMVGKALGHGRVRDSLKYKVSELVIGNRSEIKEVLLRLRPYVVVKKRQLELALKIIEIFQSNGREDAKRVFLTEKEHKTVMNLGKKIRSLNSLTGGKII